MAVQVFNLDEIYFVLNGIFIVNKIVISVLLIIGDLVLMDRNNHKFVYLGVLIQSGVILIYLENFRDVFGIFGGYRSGTLDDYVIR